MRPVPLTQQELAAVWRMLNPAYGQWAATHEHQAPETWPTDVILRMIREDIRKAYPHIPERASLR